VCKEKERKQPVEGWTGSKISKRNESDSHLEDRESEVDQGVRLSEESPGGSVLRRGGVSD
jgi:hypothetical protein